MSMILWRLTRIENALVQHGLLEPLPVPFFRVLLSSDKEKGYFVKRNSEGRIEFNDLDGPIFAEDDANRLVEALKTSGACPNCEKVQAGKINEDYHVSTFDEVWSQD